MGQRANLIIVADGKRETYYTHHRANRLDSDLFWGSEYALGFIRAQRRVDRDELLDEVWAEGGAVMDLDRRTLLWFGGEDVMYSIPLRRAHSTLMATLWPGWNVQWAAEGVMDIVDSIGVPIEAVLSSKHDPKENQADPANFIKKYEWAGDCLGSVRFESGGLQYGVLYWNAEEILYQGTAILPVMRNADWAELHRLEHFPVSGFHLDEAAHSICLWRSCPRYVDILRRVQSMWPRWTIHWHKDRFEPHAEILGPAFVWPTQRVDELIHELEGILLRPGDGASGAEMTLDVARLLAKENQIDSVQINPSALYDARLDIPLEQRRQLFESAVAAAFPK